MSFKITVEEVERIVKEMESDGVVASGQCFQLLKALLLKTKAVNDGMRKLFDDLCEVGDPCDGVAVANRIYTIMGWELNER